MTAFSSLKIERSAWQTILTCTLALWLGGSLVLDMVVVPSLWAAGMMTQPGFASAGYLTFGWFNHCELMLAGIVLTGVLAIERNRRWGETQKLFEIGLAALLLAIALIDTYLMTPHLSALGLQLNLFDPAIGMPEGMISMHLGYWALELLKFGSVGTLLALFGRNS
ncbi:MAG TPA: hypothetical protein IGS17_18890 [Oscillatoriales cyanobacterium M59_W2019_021]|nr:hypothetical protein [Oscillatoriales cyanobacterium M4454_W2019_049]HIK52964.1 hypothetical protein [Oscillatoriales cyanobacterium M59_W2019_021]